MKRCVVGIIGADTTVGGYMMVGCMQRLLLQMA